MTSLHASIEVGCQSDLDDRYRMLGLKRNGRVCDPQGEKGLY
jgi:hypothetical protein